MRGSGPWVAPGAGATCAPVATLPSMSAEPSGHFCSKPECCFPVARNPSAGCLLLRPGTRQAPFHLSLSQAHLWPCLLCAHRPRLLVGAHAACMFPGISAAHGKASSIAPHVHTFSVLLRPLPSAPAGAVVCAATPWLRGPPAGVLLPSVMDARVVCTRQLPFLPRVLASCHSLPHVQGSCLCHAHPALCPERCATGSALAALPLSRRFC